MALDAEFNQPSGRCIEVGAAVYDARSGQLIESYQSYVNPGEPIHNIDPISPTDPTNIVKLTGITDNLVKSAPLMKQVYEELEWFHAKHKVFANPIVWGSGVRNDSQSIYEQAIEEMGMDWEGRLPKNFMGYRVIDVKSIFQSVQIFKNEKIRGGLLSACERLGIGFEGKPHGALADAQNTFRVWYHLMKEFKVK